MLRKLKLWIVDRGPLNNQAPTPLYSNKTKNIDIYLISSPVLSKASLVITEPPSSIFCARTSQSFLNRYVADSTGYTFFWIPFNFLTQSGSKEAPWFPSLWGYWCDPRQMPKLNKPKLHISLHPLTSSCLPSFDSFQLYSSSNTLPPWLPSSYTPFLQGI